MLKKHIRVFFQYAIHAKYVFPATSELMQSPVTKYYTAKDKLNAFLYNLCSVVKMYKNKHVAKTIDDTNRLISTALGRNQASKSTW